MFVKFMVRSGEYIFRAVWSEGYRFTEAISKCMSFLTIRQYTMYLRVNGQDTCWWTSGNATEHDKQSM